MPKLALGLDYGTNSVRALLVDADSGDEVATSVHEYTRGEAGILLDPRDPNLARQDPRDWLDGFVEVTRAVVSGVDPSTIVGIGVDTTGSSPLPVDREGRPLSERFPDHLSAYCWLWKDHTGHAEAAEITAAARAQGRPYLAKCGGTYSSEWFWSKASHCARTSPEIFDAAYSWVECCDYVVGELTGNRDPLAMRRSVCAAGHKAMYAEEWGGLPAADFLASVDPRLADLRGRLYSNTETSDVPAGGLGEWAASQTGLKAGTPVAVGGFDAHFGAVGSGIRPGVLVKIIGTSTCDCMVHPLNEPLADIPGVCGIVRGSILPDCFGIEAGQSAVGDLFNWWVSLTGQSHETLTKEAAAMKPGRSGLLALDWNNGNRTVLVDPMLTGLLVGQTLHTTPAEVYRALIEATAFGALMIIRRIEEYGVAVREVVNCGGIAEKSPLVMQIYADVLDRPMKISRSAQTCALGAAIFGSVAGGAHPSVEEAQASMTGLDDRVYLPDPGAVATYARLYGLYSRLHDGFGLPGTFSDFGSLMKELIEIRDTARREIA